MRSFPLLFLLLFSLAANAQPSLFDSLWTAGDTVRVVLDTDWRQLVRAPEDKVWQPLVLTLPRTGDTLQLRGRIRTRGNVRLQVCDNPSLKIKFDKADLRAAGFSDFNDWKIVLQCNNLPRGEGYLRREQLAYDLHAVFTPLTHRTLPLVIQTSGKKSTTYKAFLIETEEQLAERLGGHIVEPKQLSSRSLHRPSYVNMCLFNYLILNTDWAVFNLHNVEFLTVDSTIRLRPIPYDFDYSGWVGTSYALPQEQLKLPSVHIPYWLGRRVTAAELRASAAHFLAQREAATALVSQYPGLDKRQRRRLLKRLESFFGLLADGDRLLGLLR